MSWSQSNIDSGELTSVYHQNMKLTSLNDLENQGVMRFIAKRPGRVVIKVKVRVTKGSPGGMYFQLDKDKEFSHQIELQVSSRNILRYFYVTYNHVFKGV